MLTVYFSKDKSPFFRYNQASFQGRKGLFHFSITEIPFLHQQTTLPVEQDRMLYHIPLFVFMTGLDLKLLHEKYQACPPLHWASHPA